MSGGASSSTVSAASPIVRAIVSEAARTSSGRLRGRVDDPLRRFQRPRHHRLGREMPVLVVEDLEYVVAAIAGAMHLAQHVGDDVAVRALVGKSAAMVGGLGDVAQVAEVVG